MNNEEKLNNRKVHYFMMQIAEKDKEIYDLRWEHKRELSEKDKIIEYYRKTAEQATERKQRAIRDSERRAKLYFSRAILMIVAMAVIPWLIWFVDLAFKTFWLWGNGA